MKVEKLNFSYGNNIVMSDVSAVFESGNISSILGLNGCGKSTLIKLLVGLIKAKSGTIFVDGEDISKLSISTRAKKIAYVPQLAMEDSECVVEDYIAFSLVNRFGLLERPKEEDIAKVHELLNKFNMAHKSKSKMGALSGGEKQIVMIAAAIMQETPIIILDEPTSALDMKNQYKVIEVLRELQENGKTIILTTHNPNHCLAYGGKVFLIKDGKISQNGNAEDMIKPEVLKEVYGNNLVYSKDVVGLNEVTFQR